MSFQRPSSTAFFHGIGSTIKQYGKGAFFLSLAAIFQTKEIIVVDTGQLVSMNNVQIQYLAYLFGSSKVKDFVNKRRKEKIESLLQTLEAQYEQTRATREIFQCRTSLPEVVKSTYLAFKEANEELRNARLKIAQNELVTKTLNTLQGIAQQEEEAHRLRAREVKNNARKQIWDKIFTDNNLKKQVLQEAIEYVGTNKGKSFIAVDNIIENCIKSSIRKQ